MWLAMSKALEPNAVLHINRAVLLREKLPAAQEVAAQYSQAELRTAFENLAELALKKHPDAMSLLGQFYEKQGLKQRATKLYEQAVNQYTAKESKKANKEKLAQPMQLPQLAPWNALGFILMTEKDPESLKQAEEAFRIGALDHDDPLSYYHLATFQTRHSGDWLQYMTKAAGSGHLEAMYELGEFYSEANQAYINPELANDKVLNKLMSWILDWKPQKLKALADEWFTTAASAGYKPAMWKLAEDLERGNTDGQDTEGALHWYKIIAGAPQFDKEERWPKLVDQARRKLQTVKRKV
jgi:TPR repeat protein